MTGPGTVFGSPKVSPQSQRDGRQASGSGGFAAALTTLLKPDRRPAAAPQEASRGHSTPQARVKASGSEPAGGDRRVKASGSEPAGGDRRVKASGSEPVRVPPARVVSSSDSPKPDAADETAADKTATDETATDETATDAAADGTVPVDAAVADVMAASVIAAGMTMRSTAGPASTADQPASPVGAGIGDAAPSVDAAPIDAPVEPAAGGEHQSVEATVAAAPEAADTARTARTAGAAETAEALSADDGVQMPEGVSRDALTSPMPAADAPTTDTPVTGPADVTAEVPVGASAQADPAAALPPAGVTTAEPTAEHDAPVQPAIRGDGERQRADGLGSAHVTERERESADRVAADAGGELLSAAPIPGASQADNHGVSSQTAVGSDVVHQPSPMPPSAVRVDPSTAVDVGPAVAATGQGLAATQHAGGGSPAPAPLAPATSRIIELVERLRTEPPPQQLVVDLEQFGVGRLVISLRADKVFVGTLGGADQPDPQWWRDLGDALDARGWSLDARDGQSQRERHQPQQQPQPHVQPITPNQPLRRRSHTDDGLRL